MDAIRDMQGALQAAPRYQLRYLKTTIRHSRYMVLASLGASRKPAPQFYLTLALDFT